MQIPNPPPPPPYKTIRSALLFAVELRACNIILSKNLLGYQNVHIGPHRNLYLQRKGKLVKKKRNEKSKIK